MPGSGRTAPELLWLEQPGCDDVALVGGKTAQLSRLAWAHRVPPGFCITTAALDAARRAEPTTLVPPLPSALRDQLAAAYRALAERRGGAEPAVAVRSSAVDEDGQAASFAGQHETYLNVVGVDPIAEAIRRCWASALSHRAMAYRQQRGLSLDGLRLAVLVQCLVPADASAVVFSANPVSGRRDEVVINATWGLGESLVGGTVTPDTYVVRKADLKVVGRRIADKQRMTVATAGGTAEVNVPRLLRSRPALRNEQAIALARLALALEAAMGWPVDVECAYQADHLHLLQCRPVTVLGQGAMSAPAHNGIGAAG
jgi:pyruvate,water dikinase